MADSKPAVVSTAGGPVTLVDIVELQALAADRRQDASRVASEVEQLETLANGLWVEMGSVLASKIADWTPPPSLVSIADEAAQLLARESADDSEIESIRSDPHSGLGGLVGKAWGWYHGLDVTSDRANVKNLLEPMLLQIAKQAPAQTLPAADVIRSKAVAAEAEAKQRAAEAQDAAALVAATEDELKRRNDSEHEMGFDALYMAAYLATYSPQAIESPLVPKRGELAYLAIPATLGRHQTRRQWVGGSSGFSFPIGHTGIRYRVGSFRGHPIEQQFLGKLGQGTLVVTNQRIAFIGDMKSTSVSLSKLLHIECYSDALAVFQEGRENPDFYFVSQPKLALFWINWVLDKALV